MNIQGSKILGKQSLRFLPIIGWCWHYTESIFLRRVWSTDKAILERDMQRLVDDYPKNYHFTVRISFDRIIPEFIFSSNSYFSPVKALVIAMKNVLKV